MEMTLSIPTKFSMCSDSVAMLSKDPPRVTEFPDISSCVIWTWILVVVISVSLSLLVLG
jgi:hypothetical protein